MQPAAFTASGAAQYIADSERKFHDRRRTDPTFPKPRLSGGRLRWLREELDAWLRGQPVANPQPEPPQLARSAKRPFIAPKPEVWPPPPGATLRLRRAPPKQKTDAADDISRPK